MGTMEQELRKLLKRAPDYYEDFETGVASLVKNNGEAMGALIDYLNKHPNANTSEILAYAWDIGDQSSDEYEDMIFYCPLLGKEIYDGDCYEIVNCGQDFIKKDMHPEITDWNVAIATCAKCGKN